MRPKTHYCCCYVTSSVTIEAADDAEMYRFYRIISWRSTPTFIDEDDGVGELVATDLRLDGRSRTVGRTAVTDAVSTDRQATVAQDGRRVVWRDLQTGVTIALHNKQTVYIMDTCSTTGDYKIIRLLIWPPFAGATLGIQSTFMTVTISGHARVVWPISLTYIAANALTATLSRALHGHARVMPVTWRNGHVTGNARWMLRPWMWIECLVWKWH